ncbi:uncharacterized protein LOC144799250 [Lissotriton helveticus]
MGLLPPLRGDPSSHATAEPPCIGGSFATSAGGSYGPLGQGGHQVRSWATSRVWLLLPLLSGTQEGQRGPTPYLGSTERQRLPPEGEVQNADTGSGLSCPGPRRLDGSVGLAGCLFPYPCPAGPPALPAVHGRPRALSVYRAPLRPYQRPTGVNEGDGDGGDRSSSAQVRGFSLPLPRRLVVEGGLAPNSRQPPPDDCRPPALAGVFHQCAEVTPVPLPEAPLHRSGSRHGAVSSLSSRTAGSGHSGYDSTLSALVPSFGQVDAAASGADGLLHPSGASRQVADAGSAVGPEVSVGPASPIRPCPDLEGHCETAAVVAHGPRLGQRQIPLPSPTGARSCDGRVPPGLGRPHGRGGDHRPLVSGGVPAPYQPFGAVGYSSSTEGIPPLCSGECSAGVHGQHHRHVLDSSVYLDSMAIPIFDSEAILLDDHMLLLLLI